ncbi:MAG TPA: hypothetical protein PK152_06820 [Anaerolineales bacterium]|jgi:hypothetical protein|nr:hypothetical protein [Anaerolineae bacterium]HRJ56300.1 hypothetical protein [Anaerolineales bacterium]HRK88829.1 hypothetical protein [Anaerolineales bacterium]
MSNNPIIPIYTTNGDTGAFLQYPYLYNCSGEWIGFVTSKRDIYSVLGEYVGRLTDDPRIVRKRATSTLRPHLTPPPAPKRIAPPVNVPLPRMMPELIHSLFDVLMDAPELLHTVDAGDMREDMD